METVLNGKQQSDLEACEGTDSSDFEMGAGMKNAQKEAQISQEPPKCNRPKVTSTDNEKEASEPQKVTGQKCKGDKQDGLVCASDVSLAEEKDPNLPPSLPPKTKKYLQNRALNQESNVNGKSQKESKPSVDPNSHWLQELAESPNELYQELPVCLLPTVDFEKANKGTNSIEIPKVTYNSEEKKDDQDLDVRVESCEEDTEGCKEEREDNEAVNESSASKTRLVIRGRSASSNSIFGSFKIGSPIKLVEELLSGEEWARFLDNYHKRSPVVPPPSASVVPAQPTTHVFTPTAHQQTLPDEFDCSDCDTEHERIHKVIEICLRHDKRTGEQQGPVKSEEPMSPRTRNILKSVKFEEETQPSNTKAAKDEEHHHQRNKKKDGTLSPHKVIMSSVFYNIPALTEEDEAEPQLTTGRFVRSSTRFFGRLKTKLRKQPRSETI